MKLNKKAPLTYQSALIYGPPKVGKTQLAGELSAHFDLVWFDLENGASTLFKLPESQQEKVELISIPDSRSYPVAIETCLKVIRGGPCSICEAHGKVACPICKKSNAEFTNVSLNDLGPGTVVVFDSLTQLTNSAIAHITKDKPEDYKLDYTDWGNLGKLMDSFLSHIQQAKFNVVCISHETEVEMEDGKVKVVPTAGTRAFSRNTAKYFGHVIYAEVNNMKHRFTSSSVGKLNIVVGSRTDVVTEKMNEPSLKSIFAIQSARAVESIVASPTSSGSVIAVAVPIVSGNLSTDATSSIDRPIEEGRSSIEVDSSKSVESSKEVRAELPASSEVKSGLSATQLALAKLRGK